MKARLAGVGCVATYGQWVDGQLMWEAEKPAAPRVGEACYGEAVVVVTSLAGERALEAGRAKVVREALQEWVREGVR